LVALSIGSVAEKKMLTLIALFIAAFVLIFTGFGYSVIEESEPWDALALVLGGCGILVLAVAVGLLIDRIRERTLTAGLTRRALGIICVVLIAGLIASTGYSVGTINDKNNTISSLNSILLFDSETVLLNWNGNISGGSYTVWNFSISYAGVLSIGIFPDASTYARVVWNAYGYQFDQQLNSTTPTTFVVFPGTVEVIVGSDITHNNALYGQPLSYNVAIIYQF